MNEYEIIADPKDYGIEALAEGLGRKKIEFSREERDKWAKEIEAFAARLDGFSQKAKKLREVMEGKNAIMATPESLKTFKIQLFRVNDSLNAGIELADKLMTDIVRK